MRRGIAARAAAAVLAALVLAGCARRFPGAGGAEAGAGKAAPPVRPEAPEVPAEEAPSGGEAAPPAPQVPAEEPGREELVRVQDYIPDILVDLRYASGDNFTGEVIYDFTDAYLRYGTVEKLRRAQGAAAEAGYTLKIWDAFRPAAAQFKLWEICPDAAYVANPNKGFSSHSRGNTVDITLALADGGAVEMPTGFDDFSALADRDYSDCAAQAAANAQFLEELMEAQGFRPYSGEWWHFSDQDAYPVEEDFTPGGEGYSQIT